MAHDEKLGSSASTALQPADFQALFEDTPTPLLVVAPPDWMIVAVNTARITATGKSREEQIGRKLFEVFPDDPSDPEADGVRNLTASLNRVVASRTADVMAVQRYPVRQADGRFVERWWTPINTPVLGDDGDVKLIIHQVDDVTELMRLRGEGEERDRLARDQHAMIDQLRLSKAALQSSEARYRQIVEGAEDFAIFTTDARGIITAWNSGAERITGYPSLEALGQAGDIIFTPEDRAAAAPDHEMNRAQVDRRAVNERWHVRRDGSRFWGSGLTMRLDQEGGGFLKIFRDRTAEHEAETRRNALADLSHAMRDLTRPGDVAFAAAEVLGRTLGLSRVGYAAIEHDAETLHLEREWTAEGVEALDDVLLLRDYGSFIDSLKRGEITVVPDARTDAHTSDEAAAALERKSARAFVNVPVLEHGRLVAVFFVNQDVVREWREGDLELIKEFTERTRTAVERARGEQALRSSEVSLKKLNDTLEAQVAARSAERDRLWNLSQDMLARADYDGMTSAVSPSWTQLLGWSEAELLSRGYAAFIHPDDVQGTRAVISQMADTRLPARYENRISTRAGAWKHVEWTTAPEADGLNFIAVGRDLSDAKAREAELEAAQDALRQSQKMEAMGSLTGGVAHDFNNLLTPIIGSLDMLVSKGVGNERERRLIDGALQAAERAKTLVQRLLAFARRQPLQPMAVDVPRLVNGMTELLRSTLGPTIAVSAEFAGDLPPARADQNQLEMALLNLAVNARDAMPGGGDLAITVHLDTIEGRHPTGVKPGQYVRICVSDTGIGMDEATLRRATEPFFSTKGVGKGTGLGLSMVHGLAAQLGGGLSMVSAPDQGTTIRLWLPVSVSEASVEEEARNTPEVSKGLGIALLVDDEDLVRLSTADMLIDLGYEVVEATSAEEALRLFDAGLNPDILITDHLMSGMSGAELAVSLKRQRPQLPVLIVSGYAEVAGIEPTIARLTKPFRSAELAGRLELLRSVPTS